MIFGFDCRYDLMLRCWQLSPADRPGFSEVLGIVRSLSGDAEESKL